jgi:TP901 family phage tail tape measure protein
LSAELNNLNRSTAAVNNIKGLSQQSLGKIFGVSASNVAQIRNVRTELDQYNNTLKLTGQYGLLTKRGFEPFADVSALTGDGAKYVNALKQVTAASDAVIKSNEKFQKSFANVRRDITAETQAIRASYAARREAATTELAQRRGELTGVRGTISQIAAAPRLLNITRVRQRYNDALAQEPVLQSRIKTLQGQINGLWGAESRAVQNSPVLANLRDRLDTLRRFAGLQQQSLRSSLGDARRAAAAAFAATSPIPENIQAVGAQSPQLLRTLQRAGLGATPEELRAQNASFSTPRLDLIRGTTAVTGEFTKELAGGRKQLVAFSAEFDKAGKVITRFGGRLSGVRGFLNQTVRDFQKVIEWTVATTVVFGTLAAATRELGALIEIDKLLQRFAITAQLSGNQLKSSFQDIADVAFSTATPLNEMINAADDIALATRRANQSTEEWQKNIRVTSEAVGILTNIAGIDTVKATSLLIAAQKQLGLSAEQLISLENKITAVAGGQSVAISDIIQGLAVLSQTGLQAGISVDQQIASLQVLSQVTTKSSSEIATAFKNIIGSIQSPGAIKELQKFGIAVKDQEGNLRPFLDILGDIRKAIDIGVIAPGQVAGVVRAIAGGPRRAPDAAAFLQALPQIQTQVAAATNATNEALEANAAILDTTAAKIVQLQTAFQKFSVGKFGDIFKQLAGGGIDLILSLISALNSIPTGAIVAVAQLVALVAVINIAKKAFGSLGGIIIGTAKDIRGAFSSETGLSKYLITSKATSAALKERIAYLYGVGRATEALALQESQAGIRGTLAYKNISAAIKGTLVPLQALIKEITLATTAAEKLAVVTSRLNIRGALGGAGKRGLGALGSKGALTALGLAGATGAAALATGGGPEGLSLGGVGSALQTAGLVAALIPPISEFGIAALALGSVLQIVGDSTKETTEAFVDQSKELSITLGQYKDAQATIETLSEQQIGLGLQMKILGEKTSLTADEQLKLNDVSKQYGDNARAIYDANVQLTDSFDSLKNILPQVATELGVISNPAFLQGASSGAIAAYIKDVQKALFEALNPQYKGVTVKPVTEFRQTAPFEAPQSEIRGPSQPASFTRSFLSTISEGANDYDILRNKVFETNGAFREGINVTNLSYEAYLVLSKTIQAAAEANAIGAEEQGKYNQTLVDTAIKAGNAIVALDAYGKAQASILRTQRDARQITAAQYDVGTQNQAIFEKLLEGFNKVPKDRQEEFGKLLSSLGNQTTGFDTQALDDTTKSKLYDFAVLMGIPGINATKSKVAIDAFFSSVGPAVAAATEDMEEFGEALDFTEKIKEVNDILTSELTDIAQKQLDLQSRLKAGEFKGHEEDYRKEAAALDALAASANSYIGVLANADAIEAFEANHGQVIKQFQNLPGFIDIANLSLGQFVGRLFDMAEQQNFTAVQTQKLTKYVAGLFAALQAVAAIKRIDVAVVISTITVAGPARLKSSATGARGDDVRFIDRPATRAAAAVRNNQANAAQKAVAAAYKRIQRAIRNFGGPSLSSGGGGASSSAGAGLDVSTLDIPDEIADQSNARRNALVRQAIRQARRLQRQIPGARKEAKNDVVVLLDGMKRVLKVRGVKEDLLRKALDNLAEIEKKRLEFETKADTIRRIRVGAGDFSAIANVPLNSRTGVSLGGAQGPINVSLNVNGQILTPAQLKQFADLVAASLKRQIANG